MCACRDDFSDRLGFTRCSWQMTRWETLKLSASPPRNIRNYLPDISFWFLTVRQSLPVSTCYNLTPVSHARCHTRCQLWGTLHFNWSAFPPLLQTYRRTNSVGNSSSGGWALPWLQMKERNVNGGQRRKRTDERWRMWGCSVLALCIGTVACSPLTRLPFIPLSYSEVLVLFFFFFFHGSSAIRGNVCGCVGETLTTTLINRSCDDEMLEFLV